MNISYWPAILAIIFVGIITSASAEDNNSDSVKESQENKEVLPVKWQEYKGIKVGLNGGKDGYLKFGFLGQIWMRHSELNPGTVDFLGKEIDHANDMGMRRMRIRFYANLFNKFHFYTQIGTNNHHFNSEPKPQIYIHDFWGAYTVVDRKLNVGAGLSMWNGISRLTNSSAISKLMLEYPMYIWPNLGHTDQSARQTGVFAYGTISGLNYRVAVTKPFFYHNPIEDPSVIDQGFEIGTENVDYKGYAFYSFFDREYSKTPFMAMTYLGKKKILNIGAGFDIHPESIGYWNSNGEMVKQTRQHYGVDLFMELPQPDGGIWTLYTSGVSLDFGPNYLRSGGWMNIYKNGSDSGEPLAQGYGISDFVSGTGNIWYTSVGYLLPKKYSGIKTMIQPVFASTYKSFDGLNQNSWQYDIGVNYYMYGHNFKLSAQYSSRPIYSGTVGPNSTAVIEDYKGMMILQFQINI